MTTPTLYVSQILIVESSKMFGNFKGTLDDVTTYLGLPAHDFEYDSRHQHSVNVCELERPELFAEGGRYCYVLPI